MIANHLAHSFIYQGHVLHRRFEPVEHQFKVRLFMMYVDLAELPVAFDRNWFWSARGFNLAWFRRADYLAGGKEDLADSVRQLVFDRLGATSTGPIRLLTHFRYFGYAMNPISVFYCFDTDQNIEFVVAEVTNTPWGERHHYVLDARDQNQNNKTMKFSERKNLHVSPFLEMDFYYRFQLSRPGDQLSIHIENHRRANMDSREINGLKGNGLEGESLVAFDAMLTLKRRPITRFNLARVLLRYPLMTVQVLLMIYWQAFRLWLKKVKFQPHPNRNSDDAAELSPTADPSNTVEAAEVAETDQRGPISVDALNDLDDLIDLDDDCVPSQHSYPESLSR